ncbi:MAG: hypothetical protein CM15mV89_0220 [Caudoviricetes sp.]|nr:MAG: hypothetical protein CM15mV89_0220 [Caudoviricetes sp.]
MILGFIHRESLLSPFMSGVLAISDSADFLNGLDMDGNQSPIEGGEIVKITVKTPVSKDELVRHMNIKYGKLEIGYQLIKTSICISISIRRSIT